MVDAIKEAAADKLVSRTFWLTVSIFTTATVLLWNGKVTPEVWGNVATLVLMSYAAKSVGEKYVGGKP